MRDKEKAYCFLISFFCFVTYTAVGQDQKVADSLKRIYQKDSLQDSLKLRLLKDLAFNETNDYKLAVKYSEELIKLAEQKNDNVYLYSGYFLKGNAEWSLGNLAEALNAYFKSGEIAQKANDHKREGNTYGAIANIYVVANNHTNARLYYKKAIATLRKSNDSIALASTILNSGDEYRTGKIYDSALLNFNEAGKIFERLDYSTGKAYTLGNIGMVYAAIGRTSLAEKNLNEAIEILQQSEDYYPICVYLISMCDIFLEKGDNQIAMNYALRSLQLAEQVGLKEQITSANLKLSELYEKAGNIAESFKYYKNYVAYRDSINNIKSVQKMADLRTDYEVSQKQVEVDLLNQQKKNQQTIEIALIVILTLTTVILVTLYWYYRTIKREKKRSESLLLNILPNETAEELKLTGKVDAVKFDEVTVLFTDFVAFSKLAESVKPEQVVKSIDFYFKGFDEITTKYGLEKIKTIGDSYMCASGLPTTNPVHAKNAINAAMEMIDFVTNSLNAQDGLSHFEIRIGIHTGPVVAGIVGLKKWQYDIWGDTVNIASRMEAKSEPGRINLSETTYYKIRDEFPCIYRGEIEVKNRGILKMYFLN
jgi:class 3 adenylate cyclase